MGRALKYLLHNFTTSFISLFGTLFLIVSIIFFIKISSITYVIEVNFVELGKMYLLMMPRVLLFTLPLSFFIALSISLFRLSKENETTVLFTLGYSPKNIAKFFTFLAFLLSIFLLLNALILIPLADQLSVNFVDFKKSEAKINLKPSKSGQSFSNWFILIDGINDVNKSRKYNNIVLYETKKDTQKERLVLSKSATLFNNKGELNLILKDGNAYEIHNDSLHEATYSTMTIRTQTKSDVRPVNSIVDYWLEAKTDKKRAEFLALFTLISLFPLATVLFAPSFGIVTYRYNNGEIYGYLFAVMFAYFALTIVLSRSYPLLSIFIVSILFFLLSLRTFQRKILQHF